MIIECRKHLTEFRKLVGKVAVVNFILLFGIACGSAQNTINGVEGCFPGNLPDYITPLTAFGQRAEWSLDGESVYFVDKAGGDVWQVDLATKTPKKLTDPTFRPEGHGYYRVYVLFNGDLLFTCGPERHNLYMQVLRKGTRTPVRIMDEKIDEGPAISKSDMRIVWTPNQKAIYSGRIVYDGNQPKIENKEIILNSRMVIIKGVNNTLVEPQNFRGPSNDELIWTQYGKRKGNVFTSETLGYNFKTKNIINYTQTEMFYDEPEGIFPNGQFTLIESDRHSGQGITSIDIYKLKLDGSGKNYERLTFFNDLEGYKASNPVVNNTGDKIAFQAANAKDEAGVGCGIYILDMQQREKLEKK